MSTEYVDTHRYGPLYLVSMIIFGSFSRASCKASSIEMCICSINIWILTMSADSISMANISGAVWNLRCCMAEVPRRVNV